MLPFDPQDLRAVNYVKLAFVVTLQEALASQTTPPQYRFNKTDPKAGQIRVYRGWPKVNVFLPCVTVETGDIDMSISSLDHEQAFEVYDSNGNITEIVYSGKIVVPVTLSVATESVNDRDSLVEMIGFFVRFLFRDLFYRHNIPYLGIRMVSKGTEVIDGKVMYTGEIEVTCQTEFNHHIPISLLETINAIDLNLMFGTNTGSLHPQQENLT